MNYQRILDEFNAEIIKTHLEGRVADYIPELSAISPNKFGMSLSTIDNKNYFTGDADEKFSSLFYINELHRAFKCLPLPCEQRS